MTSSLKQKIEQDPYYIRSICNPSWKLIGYALSLDPFSYQFKLRVKNPYKTRSTCCLYHYNRDVKRGYISVSTPKSLDFCSSVSKFRRETSEYIGDYSHLEISNLFYSDDIDYILMYARRNIKVLDQLDEELAVELEEYLKNESHDHSDFQLNLNLLSKIKSAFIEFLDYMYKLPNEHDL